MVTATPAESRLIGRLGLRRIGGNANLYVSKSSCMVNIRNANRPKTTPHESSFWFGVSPAVLEQTTVTLLVCGDEDHTLVLPSNARTVHGEKLVGLRDLVGQGRLINNRKWEMTVGFDHNEYFEIRGSGWKHSATQYWARFDLLGEERFFLRPHVHEQPDKDVETCWFCRAEILDGSRAYWVRDPEDPDPSGGGHSILGKCCAKCAWDDAPTKAATIDTRIANACRDLRYLHAVRQRVQVETPHWSQEDSCS